MNCSCTVGSYGECEGSYGFQKRRAAKPSACPECRRPINTGDWYYSHTTFIDSIIYNAKNCEDCQQIIDTFFANDWMYGNVWEDLESYFEYNWQEDLPTSCIVKLSPYNRDRVCDLLQFNQEE